jgi:hypothetical protein
MLGGLLGLGVLRGYEYRLKIIYVKIFGDFFSSGHNDFAQVKS